MANALIELKGGLQKMEAEFSKALPSHINPAKFVRAAQTAIMSSYGMEQADRNSIYKACTLAAQDGLIIDGREAALVTFNSKNGRQAQYMPMVAGLIKKARQSGQISSITAQLVYEKDAFSFNPAMDAVPNHNPDWFGDRGKMIGCYAVAHLKDGGTVIEIMGERDVNEIRKRSRAKDNGPWVTDTGEMWRKTVLKRLCKYLPSSTDLDNLIEHDNKEYELHEDGSLYDADTGGVVERDATPQKPAAKKQTKTAAKVREQVKEEEPPAYVEAEYEITEEDAPI